MSIQWYPGHMAAARKKAAATLARIDMVIEVVDARLPAASSNPMIDALRRERQRPRLKVLNKADLADPTATARWLSFYERQKDTQAVAISCRNAREVARVPQLALALAPHRGTTLKPLRMMIMGVPNVGKSTLINALLKSRTAAVGDEPAVTKAEKRYDLSNRMTLTDTPGLLWPDIADPRAGLMLAASHAVGRNAIIESEVAHFLAEILLARYPVLLAKRYGFATDELDGAAAIEALAARRGLRAKGGAPDLERAALVLLQDYRSGALGRISLETPEERL